LNLIKLLLLPILLIAIVIQHNFMTRYQLIGEELISKPAFAEGLKKWKVNRGDGEILTDAGIVTFANGSPKSSTLIFYTFPVPLQGEAVLVQAEILVDGVRGGNRPYEKGRIYLVGRDFGGNLMWSNRHVVSLHRGTADWEEKSQAIPFNPEMTEMVLGIGLQNATGVMQVRNLSLHVVNELSSFWILSTFLLVSMVCVLMWHAVRLFRFEGRRLAGAGTWILGAFIVIGVSLSGGLKNELLHYINALWPLASSPMEMIEEPAVSLGIDLASHQHISLDKLGHFVFFALITIYARKDFPTVRGPILALNLLIFAATTETFQFFTFGRLPSFMDIGIDSAGILVGFAYISLASAYRKSDLKKSLLGQNRRN